MVLWNLHNFICPNIHEFNSGNFNILQNLVKSIKFDLFLSLTDLDSDNKGLFSLDLFSRTDTPEVYFLYIVIQC